ncbi:GerW family sporulation protein [Clostridium sp. MSJ-4]|uniref:GerW family sporulation protein n=1 Tax=Clostridium simiarum TaxID=2841506 RepID=A0ABS6EXK6_9CLOT|nr:MULTISPECIES: GerW family sporulation protein [Clostridium]MBU5590733.1 GerW family sporulation protein [Clostridium simiarum]
MENHPIDNLMKNTMESIRDMVDVNTIIGDAVETKDGSLILPISKVSFGFASGGSEFAPKCSNSIEKTSKFPFGGGSGAGVSIKPVAFLVLRENNLRLLSVDQDNTYDKIVDTVPQVIDMMKDLMNKKENKPEDNSGQCICKE